MSVFIIAQLRFKDRELYNKYQARFAEVFRKFKGKLIAAEEHAHILEGDNAPDKVVILEFPDETAAQEFHSSSEYREIAIDRQAGADALVLQVRGIR
jgi:uncharacterized protein (DUF1330 family)